MHRRAFLGALALGGIGAVVAGAAVQGQMPATIAKAARGFGVPRSFPRPIPAPVALPIHFLPPALSRVSLRGGSLFHLPGDGNSLALTVDDGKDTAVVAAYAKFCLDSGMRVTFFLNGSRPSWTDNAPALKPLIASGQVQLGNHTWSHPNLTTLSHGQIVDELMINHDFITKTYGVDARPYFRPPYGFHDDRVDAVAASVGYTVPVMWYGSLSDATEITDAQLMDSANSWLLPQHIVIGHANHPTVTRHFGEIAAMIRGRGLQPVTLDDAFLKH
jgi:peptidoglycan/xylan/chitin deacetylase (PgdA/CDA1 family)